MIPDTRSMLPSEARRTLTAYILSCLEASPLNIYADPKYSYADLLGEMRDNIDGYARAVRHDCWLAARAEYERLHPKLHTTGTVGVNGGTLYREGLPVK